MTEGVLRLPCAAWQRATCGAAPRQSGRGDLQRSHRTHRAAWVRGGGPAAGSWELFHSALVGETVTFHRSRTCDDICGRSLSNVKTIKREQAAGAAWRCSGNLLQSRRLCGEKLRAHSGAARWLPVSPAGSPDTERKTPASLLCPVGFLTPETREHRTRADAAPERGAVCYTALGAGTHPRGAEHALRRPSAWPSHRRQPRRQAEGPRRSCRSGWGPPGGPRARMANT